MLTTIEEVLLPEWTDGPLGPKGLTWKPPPRRPVTDPVRADGESIDMALAEPLWVEGEGWAPVYVPVPQAPAYKAPSRQSGRVSAPRRPSADLERRRADLERRTKSPPPKADGRWKYCAVDAPTDSKRRTTEAALDLASADLRLIADGELRQRGISLGWFGLALPSDTVLETDDRRLAGFTKPLDSRLWVRHTLNLGEMIRTVAHEVRHLWQLHKTNLPFTGNKAACERDARDYEAAFWARHGARLMAAYR